MAENKLAELSMDFAVEILKDTEVKEISHTCGSIRRMLIASINTAKENQK